jgi:hypothetical protein
MEDTTMVATEVEATVEAVVVMAEEVEEATVAAGVEAGAVVVATEDRAGKRSVTHVCILLCGFSEASRRSKLLWAHPLVVINLLRVGSAFDNSAIYPINKGTRYTESKMNI